MGKSTCQTLVGVMIISLVGAALFADASPLKDSISRNDGPSGTGLANDDAAIHALWESNEDSTNRFMNEPSYRAGYQRAVYDLYTGRFPELLNPEPTFAAPSKKAIDLGLGRFNSGSRTGNGLMALDSARFSGGPGRK